MRRLHAALEGELRRAQARWRWGRFWRLLAVLVCAVCVAVSGLAVAIHRGYLRSAPLALLLTLALAAAGWLAFLVIGLVVLVSKRPRPWLAARLEDAFTPLLDRLNALVHLEPVANQPDVRPYVRRIERQAVRELPVDGLPSPFPRKPTLAFVLIALLAAVGTGQLLARLEPWQQLSWGGEEAPTAGPAQAPAEAPLETPPPSAAEVKPAWGEVRITDPGRDLRVTKVDVVPLQVEAASDQALKDAAWATATNGSAWETGAPPAEPNYAVYKPLLYLDELKLQDWDVLSYYASASTAKASYASEIYFIEVRPFREDIEKLPGGEDGKAYRGLNELTGLIEGQRRILRQTHRYQQERGVDPELRRQDRDKLSAAEADLGQAVRHVYAKLAAELENQPIGDVLTHLSAAESWIGKARSALEGDAPDALAKEQGALAELVATRKSFQKAIGDHPDAFADEAGAEGELPPTAELPDKLKQILELRDSEKAARELARKTLEGQKQLARKAEAGGSDPQQLAAEQKRLAAPLRELRTSQPRAFEGAEAEAESASKALDTAAEALGDPDPEPDVGTTQAAAVDALEKLGQALDRKRLAKELGHAYRLKAVLDREAEAMGRMQAEPGRSGQEEARRSAEDAREAARGLKQIAGEPPGSDAFGPGLAKALSDRSQQDLEARLDGLAHAEGDAERGAAAGRAKQAVERIARAFEESQPAAVRDLKPDRLRPGREESLDAALAQLDALVDGSERQPSPEAAARRRRELLLNLRQGLDGKGDPATTARLLLRLEEALAKDLTPEEKRRLKKLREEIESYRVELKDREAQQQDAARLTRVDPARLPAAYRDRIQRYYRKLSEQ